MDLEKIKKTMLGLYASDIVSLACMDNKTLAEELISFAERYEKIPDYDLTDEALIYMVAIRLKNHV